MFIRKYLFSWWHLESNSVRFLRLLALSPLIMWNFSVRQRLHRLKMLLQAPVEEMIDQLILQFSLLSLTFQFCLASSARLAYFLLRNDTSCCVYLCLNVQSVSPMQFFPLLSLAVVAVLAYYITLVIRQLLSSGHWSFLLQLHPFCGVVLLLLIIIDLRLYNRFTNSPTTTYISNKLGILSITICLMFAKP